MKANACTAVLYLLVGIASANNGWDVRCSLGKNVINTFYNVTYTYDQHNVQGCQHVLAQDCSGSYPMAVLVNNLNQNSSRTITILLEEQSKIEIIPYGQLVSQEATSVDDSIPVTMKVLINGRQVQLPHILASPGCRHKRRQSKSQPIAEITKNPNGYIQVIGWRVQVATDGKFINIYGGNALRNRTCGICNNFSEQFSDVQPSKHAPLSSGTLLVVSHAISPLTKSIHCQVDEKAEREVHEEERAQGGDASNISFEEALERLTKQRQRRHGPQQYLPKIFHPSMLHEQIFMQHPEVAKKMCFSVYKLGICAPGYEAEETRAQRTKFVCLQKGHEEAQELMDKIRDGRAKKFDLFHDRMEIEVIRIRAPRKCRRVSV